MYYILIILLALAFFYLKYSNYVPILMYHRIDHAQGDRNTLSPEKFAQQMDYLSKHGYHTITMEQLQDYYINKKVLPSKPVVLTFDDGYKDNLTKALPILQKYDFIGNVFPIFNWLGKENRWENFGKPITTTMEAQELLKWQAAGNYIGSHTCEHPSLSNISYQELQQELADSKAQLEALTGREITCICYPYGNFNTAVMEQAKSCGYKLGLAIFDNVPLGSLNLLALPRIPIPSGQKMWEFKLKVSKFHMIFVILRQLERNTKKLFR